MTHVRSGVLAPAASTCSCRQIRTWPRWAQPDDSRRCTSGDIHSHTRCNSRPHTRHMLGWSGQCKHALQRHQNIREVFCLNIFGHLKALLIPSPVRKCDTITQKIRQWSPDLLLRYKLIMVKLKHAADTNSSHLMSHNCKVWHPKTK